MMLSAVISAILAFFPDTTREAPVPLSELDLICLEAEDHHLAYEFEEAISTYRLAQTRTRDSVTRAGIEEFIIQSVNGRNMADFCYKPRVVARKRFSMDDFFLFYPLRDSTWVRTPNQLDSLGGPFCAATYAPGDAIRHYYSGIDTTGVRTILETHFEDTAWTAPAALPFASGKGEIYPMISGDKLYFSSRGLFGVGGYDLYRCDWDPKAKKWGNPVNLGFPYSSPADDFLLMNTPDGRHTIFASNRECPQDSVNVYVLEYDVIPVHQSITSAAELRELCSLVPDSERAKAAAAPVSDDPATKAYADKVLEVRQLKGRFTRTNRQIEAMRNRYAKATGEEKKFLSQEIADMEAGLPELQNRLNKASRELQAMEMDLLDAGIVPDRSAIEAAADAGDEVPREGYVFTRRHFRE
ncbi:MAG: hypothetical protein K6G39_03175 [Bacteroidales bacterium]|nr:hypothetical protein [Bacteroidales bacterium]